MIEENCRIHSNSSRPKHHISFLYNLFSSFLIINLFTTDIVPFTLLLHLHIVSFGKKKWSAESMTYSCCPSAHLQINTNIVGCSSYKNLKLESYCFILFAQVLKGCKKPNSPKNLKPFLPIIWFHASVHSRSG